MSRQRLRLLLRAVPSCRSRSLTVRLFLFNRFDFATGIYPLGGIAVADFNGDGRLDVVVTDQTNGTLTILLGQANGTSLSMARPMSNLRRAPWSLGDFNGDGKIGSGCMDSIGSSVSASIGKKETGFLRRVKASPVNYYASAIAVGDLNKDGKLDIAVTSNSEFGVSVFAGQW